MSLRLRVYIGAIAACAAALLWRYFPDDIVRHWPHVVAWIAICVVSEGLWLPTPSGIGTLTMASTAGLVTAMLWGRDISMLVVALSTAIAETLVLHKPPIRVFFNTCQITITMWAAATVFALLGGPVDGIVVAGGASAAGAGDAAALRWVAPILGLFLTYMVANRVLVITVVSWSTERPYLRVLREDWLDAERLRQDAADLLMCPLMAISFLAIGYAGVLLFFGPLWLLNESGKRYLAIQRAQNQLIHTERMAAKGEMAAEIGHEIRNQVAAISGRAQMLLKASERQVFDNVQRNAQIIIDQAGRMERLSKGLMGFTTPELKIERVEVNGLVQRSIEMVRTQNRFDGVEWEVRLCEPAPEVRADPGQLQQVLLNLFMNAADAMNEKSNGNGTHKAIVVLTERDDRAHALRMVVRDTGPGIPGSNLARIFEPHFTTKADGHDFGLSTSARIITNHGGRMVVESPMGQGASFTITLPYGGKA